MKRLAMITVVLSGLGLGVSISACHGNCANSHGDSCCAAGHCNCGHGGCCADDANGHCQTLGPGIARIKGDEAPDGVECAVVWADADDEEVGRTVYRYNGAEDSYDAIEECQSDQLGDNDRPESALAAACMCLPFVEG